MNLLYTRLFRWSVCISVFAMMLLSFVVIGLFETDLFSSVTFILNNLMIITSLFYYSNRSRMMTGAIDRIGQNYTVSFKLAFILVLVILEIIGVYNIIVHLDYSMFAGTIILIIMIHIADTDKYFMKDCMVYRHYVINYSTITGVELHDNKNGRYVRINLGYRSIVVFNYTIVEADEMMRFLIKQLDKGKMIPS